MKNKIRFFNNNVDYWINESMRSGASSFEEVLNKLPGVYPSLVMNSIQKLGYYDLLSDFQTHQSFTLPNKAQNLFTTFNNTVLSHIPHPLDYDWRFTNSTSLFLLDYSYNLSRTGDLIALLGIPSLLGIKSNFYSKRKLILFDKNGKVYSKINNNSSYQCNILKDNLPNVNSQVVIADPPWYKEHIHSFMWAAAQITKLRGYLILCLPPIGTRPGIETEIQEVFSFAKKLGFDLIEHTRGSISYETPLFESNALKTDGCKTNLVNWRHGDHAIFSHSYKKDVLRPFHFTEEKWDEVKINDVRIKIRTSKSISFQDPSLVSIIPKDILPSVSRRDHRRKTVDVWTSGNRIFACNATNILKQILIAKSRNLSPIENVTKLLKRKLKPRECDLVLSTANHIDEIIYCEQEELKELYSNRMNTIRN